MTINQKTAVQSHQIGRNKLARVALPERPAVREVGNRSPQSHVVRVLEVPPRPRVLHVLEPSNVVVVVDGVAVDVSQHMPHVDIRGRLMEAATSKDAPLDPERLGVTERGVVEAFEARVVRYRYVPLDDGDGVVFGEVRANVFVEEYLIELNGGSFGVEVILERHFGIIRGSTHCGKRNAPTKTSSCKTENMDVQTYTLDDGTHIVFGARRANLFV